MALNLLTDYKEHHTDGSNHFIYSRFLVPHLTDYNGWAIFIDGDMLVRSDINELWSMKEDDKAVMVVKHKYQTKLTTKYLGSKNENYPCKNWSSVMLWNCGHPSNKKITPEFVQESTGAQLHRFTWLKSELVGQLPIEWNWLPDEYGANPGAKLCHYTLGTPSFHEFAKTPMGDEWHQERIYTEYCEQHGL
jgi:lipopolysaccharide biosynthesis glycosyltransferase